MALVILHLAIGLTVLALDPWVVPAWQALVLPTELQSTNAHLVYIREGLPEMSDAAGAESGRSGVVYRREAYHPTQVIRVARDKRLVETVVDAPTLKLPRSKGPVANLIALVPAMPVPPVADLPLRSRQVATAQVVPPPPDPHRDRLHAGIDLPAVPVVPPPPSVPASRLATIPVPNATVVPAPPATDLARSSRALGSSTDVDVVPPPPSVNAATSSRALVLSGSNVVPPPPSANGARSSRYWGPARAEVVPPAPQPGSVDGKPRQVIRTADVNGVRVAGRITAGGSGSGGAIGTAESHRPMGDLVVSTSSGDRVGVPEGDVGSVAMSPAGSKERLPGMSSGPEVVHVTGQNSPPGPGTGAKGDGLGSDPNARAGLSPDRGPGGAGVSNSQKLASGVMISGGVVHLPSFGSSGDAQSPPRSPRETASADGLVVIASGRSGGALRPDLAPQGSRVYTIYLATRIGTAVLQYADPSVNAVFGPDLLPPQPIQIEIPADLKESRALVSATIDRSGALRDLKILQTDKPEFASRLITALQAWRFRPVLRQDAAIAVTAVLGFGVGTQ